MGIALVTAHISRAGVLSSEQLSALSEQGLGVLHELIATSGRRGRARLRAYLTEQLPQQLAVHRERTFDLAAGSLSAARSPDWFMVRSIDESTTAALLWETRGDQTQSLIAALCVLSGTDLLRDPIPPTPSGLVRAINRSLSACGMPGVFVSLLACYLDVARGVVEYSSAGAPLPMLYRAADDEVVQCMDGSGIPAGLGRDSLYSTGYLVMARSDVLLFSTDGLWKGGPSSGTTAISASQWRRRLRYFSGKPADRIHRLFAKELRWHLMPRRPRDGAVGLVIKREGRLRT